MNTSKIITVLGFFTAWVLIVGIFLNVFISIQNNNLKTITGASVINPTGSKIKIDSVSPKQSNQDNLNNKENNSYLISEDLSYNNNNNSKNSSNKSNSSDIKNDKTKNKFTLNEVSKHNRLSDCWMIVENKVYDITSYTNSHPGGNPELEKGCGIDATTLYNTKDNTGSHSSSAKQMLEKYYIGILKTQDLIIQDNQNNNNNSNQQNNNQNNNQNTIIKYTLSQISEHNNANNCWLIINNKAYDVTSYLFSHPAGSSQIIPYCGKEATSIYDAIGHSSYAISLLTAYYKGDLKESSSNTNPDNNQNKKDDEEYHEDNKDDDKYEIEQPKTTTNEENKIEDKKIEDKKNIDSENDNKIKDKDDDYKKVEDKDHDYEDQENDE
jgi:cytochrome b involved in lipid metabolism